MPRPNKRRRITEPEHGPVSTAMSSSKLISEMPDVKAPSKGEDDALTAEFLNIMNPRNRKGPAWANGELAKTTTIPAAQGKSLEALPTPAAVGEQNPVVRDEMSDLEWMKSRMADIRDNKDFEQSDDEEDRKDVVEATKVDGSVFHCHSMLIRICVDSPKKFHRIKPILKR